MKIVEGLHVEDVGFGKNIKVRSTLQTVGGIRFGEEINAFDGKNITVLCWQPKPENWMAAEIMRILLTKKENK